ncbi:hypothetical protein VTN77DRAFT_7803 [Rasamsonia byssochlamydoides]|uniref:uncharacterized protein n=1 Tax=Rasamsonia byssochlamydoides TaxID=89139 RepID=UPI0037443B91
MAEKPSTPASTLSTEKVNKKRKRQEAEESKTETAATTNNKRPTNNDSEGPSKKKRKRYKNKYNKNKDKNKKNKNKSEKEDVKKEQERQERPEEVNESISKMDGRLLADYFMQKAKRHNKDLSAVELNDLSVPEQAFLDTTSFEASRTLAQLPAFLKAYSPEKGAGLSKASEEKGCPHTLVVAAAGLRAADLVRALRTFQNKEATVAKLFAKHIKLDEAKQFLQRTRVNIGVGTPMRLIDLIESGALKTQELERIVIDGSHIDVKKRGIFDMKEMHFPLLQLLTRPEFRERYGVTKGKGLKVLVF